MRLAVGATRGFVALDLIVFVVACFGAGALIVGIAGFAIDRIASANCLRAIAPVPSGHCVVRHDLKQKNERRLGSGACCNIGGAGLTFQDMHRR